MIIIEASTEKHSKRAIKKNRFNFFYEILFFYFSLEKENKTIASLLCIFLSTFITREGISYIIKSCAKSSNKAEKSKKASWFEKNKCFVSGCDNDFFCWNMVNAFIFACKTSLQRPERILFVREWLQFFCNALFSKNFTSASQVNRVYKIFESKRVAVKKLRSICERKTLSGGFKEVHERKNKENKRLFCSHSLRNTNWWKRMRKRDFVQELSLKVHRFLSSILQWFRILKWFAHKDFAI